MTNLPEALKTALQRCPPPTLCMFYSRPPHLAECSKHSARTSLCFVEYGPCWPLLTLLESLPPATLSLLVPGLPTVRIHLQDTTSPNSRPQPLGPPCPSSCTSCSMANSHRVTPKQPLLPFPICKPHRSKPRSKLSQSEPTTRARCLVLLHSLGLHA
jgi:hypothetical protein